MRLSSRFATLIFAILLASLLGCAATSTQEELGQYGEQFDDAVISRNVKAAIFSEPSLKSAEINVETLKGTVKLSGVVKSQADIIKAVDVVRSVNGVSGILAGELRTAASR